MAFVFEHILFILNHFTPMDTKEISIQDYTYNLPDERIAKYPLPERDHSKLLIYRQGDISEKIFCDLPNVLPENALLVRNNTKVIRARLLFRKATGAQIEIFCLDPMEPVSYELSLSSHCQCSWHCMLGNAKRWQPGSTPLEQQLTTQRGEVLTLQAERMGQEVVTFRWDNPNFSFGEILELMGILPIPPYLNRKTEVADLTTYQTVYAHHQGSVAAPTAGLHFTPEVFSRLAAKDIPVWDVTLHVGAGTFKPVKSESIGEHEMHRELIIVNEELLKCLAETDRTIVAVGTTSVRTLESLYWLGLKIIRNPKIESADLSVTQWESYEYTPNELPDRTTVFGALVKWVQQHETTQIVFPTGILIAPGYRFRVVQAMITNFHQPHSTLLLLIGAFIGKDWRRVYDYALGHGFRFLSYGDSSLLMP